MDQEFCVLREPFFGRVSMLFPGTHLVLPFCDFSPVMTQVQTHRREVNHQLLKFASPPTLFLAVVTLSNPCKLVGSSRPSRLYQRSICWSFKKYFSAQFRVEELPISGRERKESEAETETETDTRGMGGRQKGREADLKTDTEKEEPERQKNRDRVPEHI